MFNTKTKIEMFDFYDVAGMKARLEEMAEKGWMIKHIDRKVWTYKRISPQKVNFAVTHFANYSLSEAEPDRGQTEFLEICGASGWQLAVQYNSLFVFVNYSENPVPLETDAITQVETLDDAMRTEFDFDRRHVALLLIIFPFLRSITDLGSNPSSFVKDPTGLLSFFVIAAFVVMFAIEKFNYRQWYKKAMEIAEYTGDFAPTQKNRQPTAMIVEAIVILFISEWLLYSYDPVYLAGIYISFAVASGIYFYAHNKNKIFRLVTGGVVIAATVFIMNTTVSALGYTPREIKFTSVEQMPVSMEKLDIVPTKSEYKTEYSIFRCFLYDRYQGSQQYIREDINRYVSDFSYTLVKVKSDSFYRSLKRDYQGDINGNSNNQTKIWKATATQDDTCFSYMEHYTYQIFYPDTILILRTPSILSEQQISTIVTDLVEKYS